MRLLEFFKICNNVTEAAALNKLSGLAAEARKAGSFEEFQNDFVGQIKHGTYWHVTEDPNFTIDPMKGPRDMSSMASGSMSPGELMITSHLEHWAEYYNTDPDTGEEHTVRPYAALIDMSDVPRNAYRQVGRGFGNEFFVSDPSKARVTKVLLINDALALSNQLHEMLPQNIQELQQFYQKAVGLNEITESMNFYPSVEKKPKHWSSAFPQEWIDEIDREKVDWKRYHGDYDYEPPQNPEYRPDLDLNLSNANMAYILGDVLGFQRDEGFHIPIDQFLGKAQIWLQKNLGQTAAAIPSYEHPREFGRKVTTDPETGLASISGGLQGPKMIDVGRREGYDNQTIMRMVKIASLGKEMGATHVSAF